jgi:hypothetical protein
MDNIDIIDPTFSLDVSNLNDLISDNDINGLTDDYAIYIYIGIALLVVIIGVFIFNKITKNNTNQQNEEDCPGGFCVMNQSNKQI